MFYYNDINKNTHTLTQIDVCSDGVDMDCLGDALCGYIACEVTLKHHRHNIIFISPTFSQM